MRYNPFLRSDEVDGAAGTAERQLWSAVLVTYVKDVEQAILDHEHSPGKADYKLYQLGKELYNNWMPTLCENAGVPYSRFKEIMSDTIRNKKLHKRNVIHFKGGNEKF